MHLQHFYPYTQIKTRTNNYNTQQSFTNTHDTRTTLSLSHTHNAADIKGKSDTKPWTHKLCSLLRLANSNLNLRS